MELFYECVYGRIVYVFGIFVCCAEYLTEMDLSLFNYQYLACAGLHLIGKIDNSWKFSRPKPHNFFKSKPYKCYEFKFQITVGQKAAQIL